MNNFALAFVAVFVALDIVGTLPLYVGMTSGLDRLQRNRVVNTSMLVALAVALVFVFLGESIFKFLGIAVFDFKIAGGLILLLVSLSDLVGEQEASRRASGSTGIVPLAVPLITGPGVLATLMLQVNTVGHPLTLVALFINYALAWFLLRHSHGVTRIIGKDGTVVVSKISALLLAAIAVAMMRSGIIEAYSSFVKSS
ncbi:MAG: hypothetical protein A2070_04110 [Bdellovibrionales bacterium GWC1_52_8]|nr:MAG: hypothetical protein A2Z97_02535 [Bdellovibrionales bacterium GWB1_52_6]OFZ03500.1 MAG: hypothetical protein A2X97_06020 [Bdellovibrionales bacterium GWA1_52_35]OFZ37129.1 MAG: hypothetical protein A2070_04110 [Bdellovibrionales bacterium GWC1_52_8]HCM41086.1 MarC family protein [Bdellovibrionales bacterium]